MVDEVWLDLGRLGETAESDTFIAVEENISRLDGVVGVAKMVDQFQGFYHLLEWSTHLALHQVASIDLSAYFSLKVALPHPGRE